MGTYQSSQILHQNIQANEVELELFKPLMQSNQLDQQNSQSLNPEIEIKHIYQHKLTYAPHDSKKQSGIIMKEKANTFVGSNVSSLCYSPNGKILASGDYRDGYVRLWDANSGSQIRLLKGHERNKVFFKSLIEGYWVFEIHFTSDSKTILSCSGDCTIRIWNVESGVQIYRLKSNKDYVIGMSISPDDKYIVSVGREYYISIWDLGCGSEIDLLLNGHSSYVNGVCFSPDGQIVATCSNDQTIIIWNFSTRRRVRDLRGHTGGVWKVRFSSDGNRVISSSGDRTLRIWDIHTSTTVGVLVGHTSTVRVCLYFSDNKYIASSSDDGTVRLWCAVTYKQIDQTQDGHYNNVYGLCISPDECTLSSASRNEMNIKFWNIPKSKKQI